MGRARNPKPQAAQTEGTRVTLCSSQHPKGMKPKLLLSQVYRELDGPRSLGFGHQTTFGCV